MEIVKVCTEKSPPSLSGYPCNTKCGLKYIQPPRVESYAPQNLYRPSSKPFEAKTTYHLSYLDGTPSIKGYLPVRPYKPNCNIAKPDGKISDDTTNKSSYRPVWNIVKAKAILPQRRQFQRKLPIESVTTAREDYVAKYVEKARIIPPRSNIRRSSEPFDGRSTVKMSYVDPGPPTPRKNFKPDTKYTPSNIPFLKDTTQKLSYQPFPIKSKEIYPWMLKATYNPPDSAMCEKTTYNQCYLKNQAINVVKPILPNGADIFPCGAQFSGRTMYNESFLPCELMANAPILPIGSIALSDEKMSCDTTTKLSYKAVRGEKREPIIQRAKNIMSNGPMQSETTNRRDFVAKVAEKSKPLVPCDNIQSSCEKFESSTTSALSFQKPSPMKPIDNFKPVSLYKKPTTKLETETINKLSFQAWEPVAKEELSWMKKYEYQPPKDKMAGSTLYNMSYPAPGYYVEECPTVDCPGQ
ncbi:stabilizer of axonemal microtubules 2-like [Prorops nasuta]|uniref:stabilizer of axonemal microtubules 2-like n=1 Tax=Prorops nasuta TaxID=863751 RepID=UPI0034CD47D8